MVVRWYREHGYHFVVLTDHDSRTPVEGLNALFGAPEAFLVLPGVEVTDRFAKLPVHVNGINVSRAVRPLGGGSVAEVLSRDARAVREAGGLPHVNHPNYLWAVPAEAIAAASEARHFEVWNGHPAVNNAGGSGSPSTDEIWDRVLSSGRVLYGLATDDAHDFHGELGPLRASPGRGFIMVRSPALTPEALVAAIDRGDFYASTGVVLTRYEADEAGIRLELPEDPTPRGLPYRVHPLSLRYRTYFIGKGGEVLKRDESLSPSYAFQGDELYVRARVEASNGTVAWTQPVSPGKR